MNWLAVRVRGASRDQALTALFRSDPKAFTRRAMS